ncbi:hypothetical protein RKD37_001337 [Streptomyces ambofaciens]
MSDVRGDDAGDLLYWELPVTELIHGRRARAPVSNNVVRMPVDLVVGQTRNLVPHHLRATHLAASRHDGRLVMYRLTDRGHHLTQAVLAPVLAATATAPEPEPEEN